MFNARLKGWGFVKNVSRQDWLTMAILHDDRKRAGQAECRFLICGKIIRAKDLKRYIQQQKLSDVEFLLEARRSGDPASRHIRCITPQVDGLSLPDNSKEPDHLLEDGKGKTPRTVSDVKVADTLRTIAPEDNMEGLWQTIGWGTAQTSHAADTERSEMSVNEATGGTQVASVDNRFSTWPPLNPELGAMIARTYETFGSHACPEDNTTGASGRFSNDFPTPSYDIFIPYSNPAGRSNTSIGRTVHLLAQDETGLKILDLDDDDYVSAFEAAYMGACMYRSLGQHETFALCLEQATSVYRRMCAVRSPSLLTSACDMLVWLSLHAEGTLIESIIKLCNGVAIQEQMTGAICTLLEWMTAAAGRKIDGSHVDSSTLERVRLELKVAHGESHPHFIVASYLLSFQWIKEGQPEKAEIELLSLEEAARNTLGPSNPQVVNILGTLSRAQARQGNFGMALKTINRALSMAPLGWNHPHRLELYLRQGLIYWKLGQLQNMEDAYLIAVRGRVATLGRNHPSTQRACDSLVEVMGWNGTWDEGKKKLQRYLKDPQVAGKEHETWWRTMVEGSNRES